MEEVPVVFAAPKTLRALNVAAVGASISACTAASFMYLIAPHEWTWALIVGIPTAFCGALWATCLRWRKTTRTGVRYGWLLSVPIAALCSALSGGAFFAFDVGSFDKGSNSIASFIGGALLGGTFGVVVWLPALLLVLALFGLPIARAQRLARLGVAGEERGEILVGVVSAVLGALSLAIAYVAQSHVYESTPEIWHTLPGGRVFMHVFALAAVGTGIAAASIARMREARRRKFVARVEASEVPGFRVEKSRDGKVLLRVAPVAHYRVADVAEELYELDDEGKVTHPVQGASRSQSA